MKFKKTICLVLTLILMFVFTASAFAFEIEPKQDEPKEYVIVTETETMTGEELEDYIDGVQTTNYVVKVATGIMESAVGIFAIPYRIFQLLWGAFTIFTIPTIEDMTSVDTDVLDAIEDGTLSDIDEVEVQITYRKSVGVRTGYVYEAVPTQIRVDEL